MVRTSGVLLHPTSLPGPHGIGSLGDHAHRFVDWLADTSQTWWQMLPIGPTGYGDSPYQSPSTFAGNPLLIDLDDLHRRGLLPTIGSPPPFPAGTVDFGMVIPWKMNRLAEAVACFRPDEGFDAFAERHGDTWLDDFALFTALKRSHQLRPWWEWDEDLIRRRPKALAAARRRLSAEIRMIKIEQHLFDLQFGELRRYCATKGISLIGDIPIFVAHDSADVWANPELFFLDDKGMPTVVAGVPPDYFSPTGQRWGNPLYDWDRHIETGFRWWTKRMARVFSLFDLVRVDHFRGFAASYHIPADEETAVRGEWIPAPGRALFDHLSQVFTTLPVIAEDLGVITDDVIALRDRYNFPGMKILQFGFGTESHHGLDQFRENVVAYTGTHDNDTAIGWFRSDDPDRELALTGLGSDGSEFHWSLIAGVMSSIADTAIIPLQDVLGLGTGARMNTPGTTTGNWRWRYTWDQIDTVVTDRFRRLTVGGGRQRSMGTRTALPYSVHEPS